jgi:hypothetical protein
VRLEVEILERPPNSDRLKLEQKQLGGRVRESTKVILPEIKSGYYLVRIFLKGDATVLKSIKEVAYHLGHANFQHQDFVIDKGPDFSFLLAFSESTLKIEYAIDTTGSPTPGSKSLVPLTKTQRTYEEYQLEAK